MTMVKEGFRHEYFSCFLRPSLSDAEPPTELLVASRFWYQAGPSVPVDLLRRTGPRNGFLSGYPIAWIELPITRVLSAFWVPHRWAAAVAALQAGEPVPPLPTELRNALWNAGILTSRDYQARVSASWNETIAQARMLFARQGYVNVKGLLHPSQRAAFADYYRHVTTGIETIGDSQCPGRYGVYNERLARFLHLQFAWLVGQIAAEEIIPSYAYYVGYRPGAELVRHNDREQCEISVSLLVDYQCVSGRESSWPLHFETPCGEVAVHQDVGDAIVYRGTKMPHWRTELGSGCSSDSVLLHYVPRSFSGPLR